MDRKDQKIENTWDLSALSPSGEAWEKDMKKLSKLFSKASHFKEHLGDSSDSLYEALSYYRDTSLEAERLGSWAYLMYETDGTDGGNMRRLGMYQAEAAAFARKLADNCDGSVVVHKVTGQIRKLKEKLPETSSKNQERNEEE